jgi:hypothetical protein
MEGDKGRNITELYDDMLDTLWQRVHSFEDPFVLFRATHLPKLSFRSDGLNVKKRLVCL